MDNKFFIRYQLGESFLEQLNGRTKVLLWFSSIFLLMVSYDLRLLLPSFFLHLFLFLSVYRGEKELKGIMFFVMLSNLFNLALLYFYSPQVGSNMAGQVTVLWRVNDYLVFTYETLIFFLARLFKVMGSLFVSLWLILSITPSQLAEGFYKIGFSYRIGAIIALALRYVPDVLRDYKTIREAMQLRGEELSPKKASIVKRFTSATKMLIPLLLISFERVEVVASAMELRAFGRYPQRTYYVSQEDSVKDKWVLLFSAFQMLLFVIYVLGMIFGFAPQSALWLP